MTFVPGTKYVRSGNAHIAYQVIGDGPVDLVYLAGGWGHLEARWDWPPSVRLLRRLEAFSRLICIDKRGTGLSDRGGEVPTLEQQVDDIQAVLDDLGSTQAWFFGVADGGCLSILYAATYPDRTLGLVTFATAPRGRPVAGLPGGVPAFGDFLLQRVAENRWGDGSFLPILAPSSTGDDAFAAFWSRYERQSTSPGGVVQLVKVWVEADITSALAAVRVPTLILHYTGDLLIPVENGPILADAIDGARYVELPGQDYLLLYDGGDRVLDEVEQFVTGEKQVRREPGRELATVVCTDIVGSTERLAVVGDRAWRDMLDQHEDLVRREIGRYRGQIIDWAGDGVLATFDGPARAVRFALAVREGLRDKLGLLIRAGVHTGEVERRGINVVGLTVHLAARLCAAADPGQVAVSSAVRELTAGGDLDFADGGMRRLKGVPSEWQLWVASAG